MGKQKVTDEMLLESLLCTKSVRECATTLNLSPQAVYARLRKSTFKQRLQQERKANFDIASSKITNATGNAVECLKSIVDDKKAPCGVRVRAAAELLNITLKCTEISDIITKIESIERKYLYD